jgi:hypothetical protein
MYQQVTTYESLTIAINRERSSVSLSNGQIYFRSQWEDYIYRNEAMTSMCFYDFVTDTYEMCLPKLSIDATSNIGQLRYLAAHPKFDVYGRIIRRKGHNTVAYFKHGYVPDARDETKAEWYAATVMAVFCPTRDLAKSKLCSETWTEALMSFRANCRRSDILFWIDNCQYRHDAETSARRKNASEGEHAQVGEQTHDDVDHDFYGRVEGHDDLRSELSTPNCAEFVPNVNTQLFATAGMLAGEQAGLFPSNDTLQWTVSNQLPRHSVVADEDQLSIWKQAMSKDAHLQVEFGINEENDGGRVLGNLAEEEPAVEYLEAPEREEVDVLPLLPDQQRAFNIVRNQVVKQSRNGAEPPLRLVVLGEGGTGKSELINRIRQLLRKQVASSDRTTQVVSTASISAFTGIAASHIGGSTMHKEWGIQVRQNRKTGISLKVQQELVEKHKWHNWIIIDEISMTSSAFLLKVARQADIAKAGTYDAQSGTSFGNMNVVLLGDFYQFPPVTGKPLYDASERLNGDERLGRALFEQFDKVVILRDQV